MYVFFLLNVPRWAKISVDGKVKHTSAKYSFGLSNRLFKELYSVLVGASNIYMCVFYISIEKEVKITNIKNKWRKETKTSKGKAGRLMLLKAHVS